MHFIYLTLFGNTTDRFQVAMQLASHDQEGQSRAGVTPFFLMCLVNSSCSKPCLRLMEACFS